MRGSRSFSIGAALRFSEGGGGPKWLLVAAGTLLLVLNLFGVTLLVPLGEWLSPDGQLSRVLAERMARSQFWLGVLLVVGGLVVTSLATKILAGGRKLGDQPLRLFLGGLFFGGLLLSLLVQQFLLDGIAHVTDESSHLFQAQLLAEGRLHAPAPACPNLFYQHNTIISPDGRWHTKYFPGQALWLALFKVARGEALAMPVAFGLSAMFLGYLFSAYWGRMGRAAASLFLLSPSALLLGGSYMSHGTALMCSAGAVACFYWALSAPRRSSFKIAALMISGLFCGWGLITRPHDQLLGFVFLGLAWLRMPVSWGERWRAIPWMLAGFALPVLLLLVWNARLYGSMFATGYMLDGEVKSVTPLKNDALGFSERFSLKKAFINLFREMVLFHKSLLGWPTSFLFLPFAFLAWGRRYGVVVFGAVAPVVMYFFFPYYAFEFEARYYLYAIPFLLLLTVFGMVRISRKAENCCPRAVPGVRSLTLAVVVVCIAHSVLYYWPSYIVPRYGGDYEESSRRVAKAAERAGVAKALVLIHTPETSYFLYTSGFIFNDPDLKGDVIYGRFPWKAEQVDCLKQAYSDRVLYQYVPGDTPEADRVEPVGALPDSGLAD